MQQRNNETTAVLLVLNGEKSYRYAVKRLIEMNKYTEGKLNKEADMGACGEILRDIKNCNALNSYHNWYKHIKEGCNLGNCLIEEYFPPISRELSALARIRIYM
jgi:hypothetical protein